MKHLLIILALILAVSNLNLEARQVVNAPQSRGEAFMEVRKAMRGLQWSDGDFMSLFIATKPDANQTTQRILSGWVETLKKDKRPECGECIDEIEGGFAQFIKDQIEGTDDDVDSDPETQAAEVAHWKRLSDAMNKHLTRLGAYTIGEGDQTFVVLCGYDGNGNLVGVWAWQG